MLLETPRELDNVRRYVYDAQGTPLGYAKSSSGTVIHVWQDGQSTNNFDVIRRTNNLRQTGTLPLWSQRDDGSYLPLYDYAGTLINGPNQPIGPNDPEYGQTLWCGRDVPPPPIAATAPTNIEVGQLYNIYGWPIAMVAHELGHELTPYYQYDPSQPEFNEFVGAADRWALATTGDEEYRAYCTNGWNGPFWAIWNTDRRTPYYTFDGSLVNGTGSPDNRGAGDISAWAPTSAPTPWNPDREPEPEPEPTEVTPAAPVFDVEGRKYTVTATAGVSYTPEPGTYAIPPEETTVTVTATENEGYVIVGQSSWSQVYPAVEIPDEQVTPAAPVFDVEGRKYTVTATAGVSYTPEPGTYAIPTEGQTVTVTATANEGYVIVGQSSWSQVYPPWDDPGTVPLIDSAALVRFMDTHKIDQDTAQQCIDVVSAMVSAYCRGRERMSSGAAKPGISAVVLAASARLAANPLQVSYRDQAGSISRSRQGSFQGFSLAEQYILNRYRKRSK